MRKRERSQRSAATEQQQEVYASQDASVDAFVRECRAAMPSSEFDRYHREAQSTAGNSWHLFQTMIVALRHTQTMVTPSLRKAIDSVLECYEIERDRIPELSALRYDEYWKRHDGYQ